MPLGGDELVQLAKEVFKEDDRPVIPEARVFDRGFLQRDELKKNPLHLEEWLRKEIEDEKRQKETKEEKLERKKLKRAAKQAKNLKEKESSVEKAEFEIFSPKNTRSRGRKPRSPGNKKRPNVVTQSTKCSEVMIVDDDDAMLEESDLDVIEISPDELVKTEVQVTTERVEEPEIPVIIDEISTIGDELSTVDDEIATVDDEISSVSDEISSVNDDKIFIVNDGETNETVKENDDDLDKYDSPAGRELNIKVWCQGKLLRKSMQMTGKFSELYCYIAKENSVEVSQVAIYNKGCFVGFDDTPKELKISVVDILDSYIFDTREETPRDKNFMSIKIQSKNSNIKTTLEVHKLEPLSKMMELYAQQKGLPLAKLKFEFDGEKILPHHTAEYLEMECGSCIDVKLL